MTFDATVFDLDGLLVDSETVWNDARREFAAERGVNWTAEDHAAVMGVATHEWVRFMDERLGLSDMSAGQIERVIVDRVATVYESQIPFLPGAVEIVRAAEAAGPVAIASGSVRRLIDLVVAHPELEGIFGVIVSADEVARGKPSPDVYLEAARRLGVRPEDCVCLEDSGNGIRAGKAAGMRVVAVPDPRYAPSADALALADEVVASLDEAKALLFP